MTWTAFSSSTAQRAAAQCAGASHAQNIASSRVTCFCSHHQRAAKQRGLDSERARQGYQKLDEFVQAALKGERPSDGYFVKFWRLLVEWPEIITWDRMFDASKHQVLAEVNAAVKRVRPGLQVGFHIEHVNSFNPIFRATCSYADLATKADFLKVVVYNNCGGERYANFVRNVGSTVFRDVPQEELLRFNNHLLNYGDEARLEELATAGLSADYVIRETQRALAGVAGKCRILPGIDIGIPTGEKSRKASPEDTSAAVTAALRARATVSSILASTPKCDCPIWRLQDAPARGPTRLVPTISACRRRPGQSSIRSSGWI